MPRHTLWGASLATLALAAAASARAQTPPDPAATVEEVIVTATRAPEGVQADRVGSTVTVLTPAEIESRQVRVISDVLRDAPGFAVSRTGGIGGQTQVRVRGSESNHVLTLIDGIEAADPFFGEFDFGALLADDLARIEILRGPQSALYGSDAIAGVINVVTPSAAKAPGGRLRAEYGSQDTFGAAARYGVANGPLDLVANAAWQTTDGFVGQTLPGGSRKLGSTLQSYSAKLGYEVSERLRLRGVVRYTDAEADTNNAEFGRGQVDSPGTYSDGGNLLYLAAADLDLLDGAWAHSLSVQGVNAQRDSYSAGARDGGDEGRRTKLSYVTSYRLERGALTHRLTGAADWEKETYQNTSPISAFGPDTTRRSIENTGLVAQYDLELDDTAGIGGAVRHDDNDFFEDAVTWKLQGFYRLSPSVRLRAAAGTGIKNPSQTELFGYNASGPFPFVGNPNLEPERAEGWEVGTDLTLLEGRLTLAATYFDQTLEDEIFSASRATATALNRGDCPVPPAGVTTTCNRSSESRQEGLELSGVLQLTSALTLSGAYTLLDAEENGAEEVRRAGDIASANLTWTPLAGRATVNLNVRHNGEQLDVNFTGIEPPFPAGLVDVRATADGRVELPAFTLVNLAADFDVTETYEVFGRVENLTDERYYEVFGYPTQPRAAFVGVRAKF